MNTQNPLPHNHERHPPIYPICIIGQGGIVMMPKPRAEHLANDMAFYQQQGITHIVSLLRQEEMLQHGLDQEKQACETAGLGFYHLPIQDMNVPELSTLQAFNQTLLSDIAEGATIAIHCHGGRGRAGTVAISLMLESGYELTDALALAREKRQDSMVPVCDVQNEFLANYAQTIGNKK